MFYVVKFAKFQTKLEANFSNDEEIANGDVVSSKSKSNNNFCFDLEAIKVILVIHGME